MGILALKAMAHRPWPKDADRGGLNTWYEPLKDKEEARSALRFTLSHPVTAAIPPGDAKLFEMALELGRDFKPMVTEEILEGATLMKPVGCKLCNGGYKGRVGVYEVVKITPEIARIIMEEGNSIEIDKAARAEGFNDLRRSALRKAARGETSLAEVNRITTD